jgi:DNA-binding NarL/FixJ family response regulator
MMPSSTTYSRKEPMHAGDTITAASLTAVAAPSTDAEPVAAADAERGSAANGPLRVLLAERRASAQSELSRRLTRLGHEVMARVTSGQGAMDYASFLAPDVVLLSPVLEDMSGVAAAMTITRKHPGIAAVLLSSHPSAADPAARPNWGAVALVPTDAEPEDLDAALRRAVGRAREADSPAESENQESTGRQESPAQESAPMNGTGDSDAAEAGGELVITGARDAETLSGAAEDALENEAEDDAAIIARATDAVMQRSRLSRDQAHTLMQEEADDSAQSLVEVARAMLDDDSDSDANGELVAAA